MLTPAAPRFVRLRVVSGSKAVPNGLRTVVGGFVKALEENKNTH